MSETYMITAKTVEEAIAIANREYADESHEVSYEIIDMPKKGFLGIGARDAKIKVTVTKSVSADLDSLVADLKNMKVLTSKGDSGETRKERQPKQNQPKANAKGGEQDPQKQSGQNPQKQQPKQSQQKKNDQPQPKQNEGRTAQNNQTQKQSQPKENAQNGDRQPAKQNNQPKKNDKPERQNQPKNDQGTSQKPEKNSQPKADKVEKAEAKTEAHAKAPAEVKTEKTEKIEKSEKADNTEKKQNSSSLRNQAMPSKRQAQKKHNPAETEISSSGTTVSTPVGLTDYVADESASGFGSSDNAPAGNTAANRMSNDIRKSKKNQPANQSNPGNSGNKKAEKSNSVIYGDRSSMTTRYDVAESDEDYKKLNDLEDRELTIDEIRASVKMGSAPVVNDEVDEIEDIENQEAEELNAPKPEKLRREAVSEAEMNFALEFANTLLRNMGLDASAVPAECPEGEEFDTTEECTVYPKINIIGDDTGILIGHHGETLDAIQYLVNLSALRRSKQKDGDYVKIVVDIENYREKREETLRALARRMAARAVKYKRNVFLEPMNAYERRIIHSELQSFENVSTHSVGSDRDRKIIITYEGADKAPDNRRRGRKGSGKGNSGRGANESTTEATESAENAPSNKNGSAPKERRRPRKVQKMPIEKIGEILPDAEMAPESAEDVQE